MARPKAFVSYRRSDTYVDVDASTTPFFQALESALDELGFETFFDFRALETGDAFLTRIKDEIAKCDLFIPLIGPNWVAELKERDAQGHEDIAAYEVAFAIYYDANIVPIRVDNAALPAKRDLPPSLAAFSSNLASNNAPAMSSTSDVSQVVAAFEKIAARIKRQWTFERRFDVGFGIAIALVLLFTAILPNLVGLMEFGSTWWDFAITWGGLFVWPATFLPFALFALRAPMRQMVEAALLADRLGDRLIHAVPLVVALAVTAMAVPFELFGVEQAPWSVIVRFDPRLGAPACGTASVYADPSLLPLVRYDAQKKMLKQEAEEYGYAPQWLEAQGKCWPNAYFYLLTKPVNPDADQLSERRAVQRAFITALRTDNHTRRGISYSATFYAYAVSFAFLAFFGLFAITISLFLAVYRIKRWDNKELRRLSNESWQYLTYAYKPLMMWVLLRMITVRQKSLYYCSDIRSCSMRPFNFYTDILIVILITIGYIALTVGMVRFTRRYQLYVVSAVWVCATTALGTVIMVYGDDLVREVGLWRFYIGVSIPAMFILTWLWFWFSPAVERFGDVQAALKFGSGSQ